MKIELNGDWMERKKMKLYKELIHNSYDKN